MIKIFTIGKTKETFFTQAITTYLQRLKRFTKIEYKEFSKEALIKTLEQDHSIIILAINGKQYSSEELANFLKKKELEKLAFYLGDEQGLPKEVFEKAKFSLSFSPMTFPHELARVMLLEQLYRAYSINKGLPYHK